MSKLVIVESPAKAKTIQKYLGNGYEVIASMGHVRDLPKSLLGVDIANGFKPRYMDIPGKTALIRQLRTKAADAEKIFLATDPDREGEAISWHLAQILKLDTKSANRVTFNEITRSGVTAGMAAPRSIDMDLVDAQQARRVLDRIVGYKLSPLLWKSIRQGLSAGRVQSATVSLVVDRENEIRNFVSEEYWTLDALLSRTEKGKTFPAHFYGDKTGKIKVEAKATADKILDVVKNAEFTAANVKTGKRKVAPAPPFITSTMQQEANRKLNFSSNRTMKAAQELYEGVDVDGEGAMGLITYMRTDSLRISDEARAAGVAYIKEAYGENYLPAKARVFKSKNTAQDAHEAIRPSVPSLTPDKVKSSLTSDQYKLYKLIWERFVASLMADQLQQTCQVDIEAGEYIFKSSGYTVEFDGYTVLYVEGKDEKEDENRPLPAIAVGDTLVKRELKANQHFTQPPARYTEATLNKAMEENGIGRPSTYAPTISTILSREYIERENKSLKPTSLGEVVTSVMKERFPKIVDTEFTAQMEEQLDAVENGKNDWITTLDDFYGDFEKTLKEAEESLSGERIKVPEVESEEVCELCGRHMVVKSGRFGKFLACPGYPDCKNTKPIVEETAGICPDCGSKIILKKSRHNRKFYGCANYPACNFMSWDEPSAETCPKCGKTLFKRKGKGAGLYCRTTDCGFEKK